MRRRSARSLNLSLRMNYCIFELAGLFTGYFLMLKSLARYKHIVGYGLSLAALLVLLRWLELRFIIINNAFQVYASAIAVIFTVLGVWLALRLSKPKINTVVIEKEVYIEKEPVSATVTGDFAINHTALTKSGISPRELEVLQLIAAGHSNQEIADHLYVSLNTVKTHSSNLFLKLDVKRRTQAIEKAKRLSIIP